MYRNVGSSLRYAGSEIWGDSVNQFTQRAQLARMQVSRFLSKNKVCITLFELRRITKCYTESKKIMPSFTYFPDTMYVNNLPWVIVCLKLSSNGRLIDCDKNLDKKNNANWNKMFISSINSPIAHFASILYNLYESGHIPLMNTSIFFLGCSLCWHHDQAQHNVCD